MAILNCLSTRNMALVALFWFSCFYLPYVAADAIAAAEKQADDLDASITTYVVLRIALYFGGVVVITLAMTPVYDLYIRPHKAKRWSSRRAEDPDCEEGYVMIRRPRTGCAGLCNSYNEQDYQKRSRLARGEAYWDKGFWGDFAYRQANHHPFLSMVACSRLHPITGHKRRALFLVTQAFCLFFTVVFYQFVNGDKASKFVFELFIVSPVTLVVGKILEYVYACSYFNQSRGSDTQEAFKKVADWMGWVVGIAFLGIATLVSFFTLMLMAGKAYRDNIDATDVMYDFLISQAAQFVIFPLQDLIQTFIFPHFAFTIGFRLVSGLNETEIKQFTLLEGGAWRDQRRKFLMEEGTGHRDTNLWMVIFCLGDPEEIAESNRAAKKVQLEHKLADTRTHLEELLSEVLHNKAGGGLNEAVEMALNPAESTGGGQPQGTTTAPAASTSEVAGDELTDDSNELKEGDEEVAAGGSDMKEHQQEAAQVGGNVNSAGRSEVKRHALGSLLEALKKGNKQQSLREVDKENEDNGADDSNAKTTEPLVYGEEEKSDQPVSKENSILMAAVLKEEEENEVLEEKIESKRPNDDVLKTGSDDEVGRAMNVEEVQPVKGSALVNILDALKANKNNTYNSQAPPRDNTAKEYDNEEKEDGGRFRGRGDFSASLENEVVAAIQVLAQVHEETSGSKDITENDAAPPLLQTDNSGVSGGGRGDHVASSKVSVDEETEQAVGTESKEEEGGGEATVTTQKDGRTKKSGHLILGLGRMWGNTQIDNTVDNSGDDGGNDAAASTTMLVDEENDTDGNSVKKGREEQELTKGKQHDHQGVDDDDTKVQDKGEAITNDKDDRSNKKVMGFLALGLSRMWGASQVKTENDGTDDKNSDGAKVSVELEENRALEEEEGGGAEQKRSLATTAMEL